MNVIVNYHTSSDVVYAMKENRVAYSKNRVNVCHMFLNVCSVILHKDEQEAHEPSRSPEYQRFYMTYCQKGSYFHINMPIIE